VTSQPTSSKATDTLTAITLFFIVFALWQVYWQLLEIIKPDYPYDIILFLTIPSLSLAIYALFIKLGKTTLRRQGFQKPTTTNTKKTVTLSIACAAVYIIMILAPGLTAVLATGSINEGFELSSSLLTPLRAVYRITFGIAYAIILSLAYESIFRGYIFRNLVRHYGFFTSLYTASIMFGLVASATMHPFQAVLSMSQADLVSFIFMYVLTAFAAGLFLGFYFYKTGWSLLGPIAFQLGVIFFMWPDPIVSSTSEWWIALTFQVIAYAILILAIDTSIKEPMYLRKKYGLEG
jgi:membrane protease YdiL (CAAX protease family)